MEETITLSIKEYQKLYDASALLDALMASGVDNWEGYSHALDLLEED